MNVEDLDVKELVEFDPDGGLVRFAGQRALIIDAVAMGLLRRELVEHFGLAAARAVLTRFGYAHGWRMAEAMQAEFKWESDEDWRRAGSRIYMLEGMFKLQEGSKGPLSVDGSTLIASYEAEQHISHLGRSDEPVCWTICGLTSGYWSRASGREIYVLEECCIGKGDAACRLLGRTVDEWGNDKAEELRFFERDSLKNVLDVSLHEVTQALKRAERKIRERRRALQKVAREVDDPFGLVARSPAMGHVVDLARRIAKVDSTVLITGESGTGKERIARLVHDESARVAGPFIAINCGAITETLLESELFGHARGAFTGATHDRPGLFEAAGGGTLLLDEVSEVSRGMQVKLLRVLQEREIRRVGENRSRPVDVRVLAATNRELGEEVAAGNFRKDLYYRLKVVELHVPPLRERHEDLLPLARVLLAEAAAQLKRPISGLSPRAADQLSRFEWPGNVRELQNAMERAVALARGKRVDLDDLPEDVRMAMPVPTVSGPVKPLAEIEKQYILAVLGRNGGNQTRTAEQLAIGSATLYRKLKSYGALAGRPGPRAATD